MEGVEERLARLEDNQEALGKFITERLKDADSLSQAELLQMAQESDNRHYRAAGKSDGK